MTEGLDRASGGTLINWLLGIVGSLVVAGIISLLVASASIGARLTDLEATIRENKGERERIDARIERRIDNVEADVRELQREHRGAQRERNNQ